MMDSDVDDTALVERALEGDRAAFAALVTHHYDFIYRVAWKWCGNREDAEDVAQDVCVRLGGSLKSWSGQGKLTTWLYRVVTNAVHDLHRKRASDVKKIKAFTDEPKPSAQLPDACADDPAESLWRSVRQLPEKPRDAVLLVYGEGLKHAEVANILGCKEGTVSAHIHAAKQMLRDLLVDEQSEGVEL